jgi:excisionase family DNA binding protein
MEDTATLRLMTVAEVARMLNVKRSWVYGKVATREIPHMHVGRYPRFVRDDVLAWLRGDGR